MRAALGPEEQAVWPNNNALVVIKCVMIIKSVHLNDTPPKEMLLFDGTNCQYLVVALIIPLTVNFSVWRLEINVLPGILFMYCFFSTSVHVYFILYTVSVATTTNVSTQLGNIPMLSGTNFKVRIETAEIALGCMDFHLALRSDRPTATQKNHNDVNVCVFFFLVK